MLPTMPDEAPVSHQHRNNRRAVARKHTIYDSNSDDDGDAGDQGPHQVPTLRINHLLGDAEDSDANVITVASGRRSRTKANLAAVLIDGEAVPDRL